MLNADYIVLKENQRLKVNPFQSIFTSYAFVFKSVFQSRLGAGSIHSPLMLHSLYIHDIFPFDLCYPLHCVSSGGIRGGVSLKCTRQRKHTMDSFPCMSVIVILNSQKNRWWRRKVHRDRERLKKVPRTLYAKFRGELRRQRDWIHHDRGGSDGGKVGCKTGSRTTPSARSNICLAWCLPAFAPQSVWSGSDTSPHEPRLKMNYLWAFLKKYQNCLVFGIKKKGY